MSKFILTNDCYKCRNGLRRITPEPLSELFCGKNDTACFQLLCDNEGERCILNPGSSPALSYEMNLTRFRIAVKCPFPYKIYTEGYLPDENGIPCADILHECPITYDGDGYAPAFIAIEIPNDADAGVYPVEVNIFSARGAQDEIPAAQLSLSLNVRNVPLPSPQNFNCHLDLWQHNSNIARTYGVELWSNAHFVQIEKVIASLADLGQKSITVLAGDCPWRGWGCYLLKDYPATLFEYSMVRIDRNQDGEFTYDFNALRRYIELCFSYGIQGDITVYGLMGIWTNMPLFNGCAPDDYPEKLLIRYRDHDGSYKYMRRTEDIKNYILALFAYFRRIGVFDKVRIGVDEPSDHNAYQANYNFLKELAPDLQFKMSLDKTSAIETFGEHISDVAASFPCSCNNSELLQKLKQKGKRILWYVCNIPDKPNTVLHSELMELRVLGALGYLFGYDGFLRWAYTCWTVDPLKDVRYNNTALPAGDVNLIYPAKNGNILFSLRYFGLKNAIRDWELLNLLAKRGKKAEADRAVRILIKNTDTKTYMKDDLCTNPNIYTESYADYSAFKQTLYTLWETE